MEVQGHTDGIADPQPGLPVELGALRGHGPAPVVRELIARGVPGSGLRAVGLADTHPLASDEDEAGRSRNRRVEFLLTHAPAKAAAPAPPHSRRWRAPVT